MYLTRKAPEIDTSLITCVPNAALVLILPDSLCMRVSGTFAAPAAPATTASVCARATGADLVVTVDALFMCALGTVLTPGPVLAAPEATVFVHVHGTT